MNIPILNTSLQIQEFLRICGLDAMKAKTLVESVEEGILSDAMNAVVRYLEDNYLGALEHEKSESYDEGYKTGYSQGYAIQDEW